MECAAILGSGKPCPRPAEADDGLCSYHRSVETRRQARAFYTERLSAEDREALAVAARLEGVDAEIAMLRVLIRRVAGAGDIEGFRRGIDTLCRMLKARHELDEGAAGRLSSSLEQVLDTLSREIGVPL